ncbi:hypothetical protein OEZ86_003621 [Tetradesmus obliquus]|nr:hypothetical protein OEZ86_003621 [Tetradesmus obliquus]
MVSTGITGHTSSSSFSDTSQNNHHDSCGTSGRKRDRLCKVVGCSVDLCALNKPYCLKRGVCPQHLKAESVRCKGAGEQLWRFCQQCGKMEHLQQFQGKNRSCKAGLARRRQKCMMRQQQQQQQQDWQQLQAMQQQEQQAAECGNASCSMFGWHVPSELAVQQAPAGIPAACTELPWTPPTVINCHGQAIGDGNIAHSATLPAPLAILHHLGLALNPITLFYG